MVSTLGGMGILPPLILGIIGLIVGSFLGLVSVRLPRGQTIVHGRSHCDGCGRTLSPGQLVPVVSWLLSRGRCSDCGARISPRYPLMEGACGLIGLIAGMTQPSLTAATFTALLGWQLLLIAVVDGENFWLPDALTGPLLATGLIAAWMLSPDSHASGLLAGLVGAFVGFCVLWLLAKAYRLLRGRDGVGGGDPYLLGAIGAWVGWIGLPGVLVWACMAGLSVVLAMLMTRRALARDTPLPFGVFLAVGAWMTWLFGPLGLAS